MASVDYVLCGWRVRSMLALPELWPWPGSAEAPVDIEIAAGQVPEQSDAGIGIERWLTVRADGAVFLTVPDVVRILVEGGRCITVDVLGAEENSDWRLFLLGSAVGYLCHQRSAFPLHAASLSIGERTVALAGASGAGKSTLAMALLRRGHRLLSDDLTVLTQDGQNVYVQPAFPRLKLWRDALDAFGEDASELPNVRAGIEKFDLRPRDSFDPTTRRLDTTIFLCAGTAPTLRPVPAKAAIPLVIEHVARPWVARLLGRQPALFALAAFIAKKVSAAELVRSRDFGQIEETARLVEKAVLG
jgi:hypothetical protein